VGASFVSIFFWTVSIFGCFCPFSGGCVHFLGGVVCVGVGVICGLIIDVIWRCFGLDDDLGRLVYPELEYRRVARNAGVCVVVLLAILFSVVFLGWVL